MPRPPLRRLEVYFYRPCNQVVFANAGVPPGEPELVVARMISDPAVDTLRSLIESP